jgi:hypothetical protein
MHTYDTHNHPTDPSAHVDKYATHHAIAHLHTHTHTHTHTHIFSYISYHIISSCYLHSLTHSLTLTRYSLMLAWFLVYLSQL